MRKVSEETAQSPMSPVPTIGLRQVEWREWWLWGFAVAVTLVLTFAILSLSFPGAIVHADKAYSQNLREWVRGLAALVFLFDLYTVYQHLQLQRVRRRLAESDRLFQLITENAADMIAVIDAHGRRIYNSPAYQKVLGYSPDELSASSSMEQIHPEDRDRVTSAAEKARATGRGERLEYRIQHKDGSWRVLESTASVFRGGDGKVEGLVVVNRDVTDRKRAEEALAHNSFHDGLTNLANRTLLLDRLERALTISRKHSWFKFAVLFLDIDGFKVVNDSLGHAAGDELLVQISERLSACLRRLDTISRQHQEDQIAGDTTLARPGGDEFVVLAEELRNPSNAIQIAERIQKRLAQPFRVADHEIVVTGSIGIAFSGDTSAEPQGVLRDAEIAMYRAKQAGKGRCEVFDKTMHAVAVKRLQLETDMRKALERGEFLVYYQPIVSLKTGKICGFEALTRWQRAQGMVMPNDFIAIADETGIILPLNEQMLLQACRQLRDWHQRFPSDPPLTMSLNVTSKQFAQPDLPAQVAQLIQKTGMHPRYIDLEITETIAMADPDRSDALLTELKEVGVGLHIDDFGTGYSSLSRLQGLHLDTMKVDRTFVSRMDTDKDTYEIVRVIVTLAHNLGLKVVAEGIENENQLNLLRDLGCEKAQGYLFSKPVESDAISLLLETKCNGLIPSLRARVAAAGS